jgi:translation initiation factor 2 alpha subunit (eIF-2alpha)
MNEVPLVICKNSKDLHLFFDKGNKRFLNRLCKVIKLGVEDQLRKTTLCDITYDGVTKFRVNIDEKDYKRALERLLKIYEKLEEYEQCGAVKRLIKKIN